MNRLALVGIIVLSFLSSAVAQDKPASIPPGEKEAKAKIESSPRHGEYVDIQVEGREKPVRAYVFTPR